MSENLNRDFSKYEAMSTEELEEILRLDAEMPEGQESDTEKILYIMEVLSQRNKQNSHTGNTALKAYESFKQHYMPETDNNIIPVKTRRRMPRWVRSLTATAAVLAILLVGSSITARAFGFNLWKTVIQWTQETFHFGQWGDSKANNTLPYASLQEALEKANVPVNLVPTTVPDGYVLVDVTAERSPMKKTYTAIYKREGQTLRITVRDYLDKSPYFVEQSDGLTEEYEVSGVSYYLFSNLEHNRAVWLYESYECDIYGDITIEELKEMINSIQKG